MQSLGLVGLCDETRGHGVIIFTIIVGLILAQNTTSKSVLEKQWLNSFLGDGTMCLKKKFQIECCWSHGAHLQRLN